jgi:putative FmdB family regulatory protein
VTVEKSVALDEASLFATIAPTAVRRFQLMPTYDYLCKACKKTFALTMTMAGHDKARVACPKCKSRKVEQQFAGFFAVTSKKS